MNLKSGVRTSNTESGVPRNFFKGLTPKNNNVHTLRTNLNLLNIDVSQSTKAHAHGSICLNVNINIDVASQYIHIY